MKYAALYFLTLPVVILTAAALSIGTHVGQKAIFNPGPHGLTEVVYAYASMANNNGSAFAGLGSAATWYQTLGGIVMLLGRSHRNVPLGLAGSLARQQPVPVSAGTLDTRTPLFVGMVVGVILVLVGLTYFPALALGPFAEGLRCDVHDNQARYLRRELHQSRTREEAGSAAACRPEDPVEGASRRVQEAGPAGTIHNPVVFVVEVGAVLTLYTAIFKDAEPAFDWTIVVFLWLTVLFANMAEAVAEGRGKAQAESLRRVKRETVARRLIGWQPGASREPVRSRCPARS